MCLVERTQKELKKKKKRQTRLRWVERVMITVTSLFFFFQFGAKRVQLWEKAERANMKKKKNRWRNVSES